MTGNNDTPSYSIVPSHLFTYISLVSIFLGRYETFHWKMVMDLSISMKSILYNTYLFNLSTNVARFLLTLHGLSQAHGHWGKNIRNQTIMQWRESWFGDLDHEKISLWPTTDLRKQSSQCDITCRKVVTSIHY